MLTGRLLKAKVELREVMAVWLLALMVVEALWWRFWFKIGKKKDISSGLFLFQIMMSFGIEHSCSVTGSTRG
jgi:hypothetical protein